MRSEGSKPNRYTAAGVTPRRDRSRDQVIPLGAERLRRGRRVEQEITADGRVLFKIVIPTPGQPDPEHAIPLSEWAAFPCFAEPIAHALLDLCQARMTPKSCLALLGELNHFARFLKESMEVEEQAKFTPKDLTTARVGAFVKWLHRTDPRKGTAALALETRRVALGSVRRLVGALRRGQWAGDLSKTLQVQQWVWGRETEPTGVIPSDDFDRLYRACVAEVVGAMATFEQGRQLIEAARDRVPTSPRDRTAFEDLGVRLAAIDMAWPGRIPESCDGLKTHNALMRAVLKYGGLTEHCRHFYPTRRFGQRCRKGAGAGPDPFA